MSKAINKSNKKKSHEINKIIPEINNNHKNIKQIIIIQKYIRRYLILKQILIPSSYYQTKEWRKNKKWYKNGKSNDKKIKI